MGRKHYRFCYRQHHRVSDIHMRLLYYNVFNTLSKGKQCCRLEVCLLQQDIYTKFIKSAYTQVMDHLKES